MQTLKKANIFACDLPRAVVLFYKIIRNRPNPDFLAIQGPLATTTDTAGIVLYTVAVAAAVAFRRRRRRRLRCTDSARRITDIW
jgi:hypothetical protein